MAEPIGSDVPFFFPSFDPQRLCKGHGENGFSPVKLKRQLSDPVTENQAFACLNSMGILRAGKILEEFRGFVMKRQGKIRRTGFS